MNFFFPNKIRRTKTKKRTKTMSNPIEVHHPKAYRMSVQRRYGSRGFTPSPRTGNPMIKPSVIEKDLKSHDPHLRKEAQRAKGFQTLARRRR